MGGDLDESILRYVSSVPDDIEIIRYDILGSQAHAVMLHECGLITRRDAKRILGALQDLKGEELKDDGNAEDVHELVESMVVAKIGMESGGKMHTARSRNDQVSLDIRMKIRDDICVISRKILDVAQRLVSLAERHRSTAMPLYTHLQQAQVGTFSHYLLAHVDALVRDLGRLSDAFARINKSPLGAGAVGGTSLNIDRRMTAKLLGFSGIIENSLDATSSRDFMIEYVCAVTILMTNLSRIAEDFVVWSSSEFGFIEIADEFASPSSVMPQKKNPDIMEITRGKAARMIGEAAGVLAMVKGLSTGYGRDLQEAKPASWSASRTAIGALGIIEAITSTLTVNEKVMRAAAERGYLVALDVAEGLVRSGISFREAHGLTGELVRTAHRLGVPLDRLGDGEIDSAVKETGIDAQMIRELVRSATVEGSLGSRKSAGSAGFSQQGSMIRRRKTEIGRERKRIESRESRIKSALDILDEKVVRLAGRPR